MVGWKFVGRLVLISVICYVGICSCRPITSHQESSSSELPFASELLGAINQVLPVKQNNYGLGISAAVAVPGYRTWTGVSGDSQPGTPINVDMIFDVGSIAKNFEAALTLKLVEGGTLSLDDPISSYLPAYPNVDGKITIRQLLNHTSGIFNVFEHPDFPWVGSGVDYSRNWRVEEVFSTFVLEPYGPPGYAQHYSSTNYLLLTAILEKVTGASVSSEIERYFLKPMELDHTFGSMSEPQPAKYSVAHPWVDIDRDGILEDLYGIPLTWKVTLTHPVIFSTASDLVRWMQALYHEHTVLAPGSLREMLTYPEVIRRDPEGGVYGLGTEDFTNILGVQVIGHGGSSLGYSAAALYLPKYGVSMAWLVNTGESPRELADKIMIDTWSSLYEVVSKNQKLLRE